MLKRISLVLLLLVMLAGCSSGGSPSLNKQEIEQFFARYSAIAQTKNVQAISVMYALPVRVEFLGESKTINNEAELRSALANGLYLGDQITRLIPTSDPVISGTASSATVRITVYAEGDIDGFRIDGEYSVTWGLEKVSSGVWKIRSETVSKIR